MKTCMSCNQRRARIWAQRDLPNPVMMQMSHKVNKPSHYKSQIQFESDTFICNNILLHSAKYYHLDFTILLSFHHTTSFMGECWI